MSDLAVGAVVVVGALVLTVPANWLVRWILRLARQAGPGDARGAGRWIGPLERLLIYVLVGSLASWLVAFAVAVGIRALVF